MEVKPVVAVVTQKLTDTLNDESVADNKVMIHQLKGVIKSLKKLQSFSEEKGDSDASQRATDHLRVLYEVEDEVEKFTFRFAQQRKKFGFLMKITFFFNNLNSCRRLKRKIKKIQTQIPASPRDVSVRTNSSLSQQNSVTTVSDDIDTTGEEYQNDDEDDFSYETHPLTQKSSSHVWVISEIPSSPSPKRGLLTRSFTMIPHLEKIQISSSFSNQEEELGIFGLDDDIKSLVKWVTQQHERNVSRFIDGINIPVKKQSRKNEIFVPIVGKLGSGKTTLARAVYRNRKIKDHFELHDWVSVTEEYTADRILHSVSKKVGLVNENGNQNQSLLDHLKGKKYLIVIDCVGSRGVVEDLIEAFPDENNGSKVIFTSREVWRNREMNINPHILQPLNAKESWSLFLKKAGKEKEADQNQIHPMTRGRILNICRGLSLNIVLIAKLLSTKSIARWSSVIVLNQYSDDDVLSLCYNDLHIQKKLCLLYLSLFPKDYDIPVRRLLRLWLAEGFVKKRFVKKGSEEISPEDLVQEYFDNLVDRSMIEITKFRSDNSPRHCRLVSVFHDYLLPKAQDISLFYIHRNSESLEDAANPFGVRRMVHHMTTTGAAAATTRRAHSEEEDATLSSSPSSLSCFFPSCRENIDASDLQQSQPHSSTFDPSLLRSYVSFNFQRKDMPEREVGILLGRIINSRFGLLRVLDLEGVCKPNLPEKLGQLCHLRYLGLRWTFLESLPESVGDLTYLETLDVKHTCVDTLPDSIWKLKHLRHLNLNNIRLAMPPSSSSSLLTLWGLVLDEKISVNEGLGKLLDLKELGIKFNLSKSQGVLLEWIAKLKNLQSLRLISVDDMGRPSRLDLKPLRDLEKLSHLNLYGNLERLPAPIEFPPTVRVLTLSVSRLDNDPMETLEQLPSLMVLRLLGDSYIGKRMVCHGGGFKKLEVLKLWKLNDLEELDVEEEAMERLKELDIRRCHNLNDIPCRLLQKQRCLEELILTDMPDDFVERIKKRKSKDTSMTINPWKLAP
ncbi:unnamed protein product [Lactuca virosa]|uniref:NB-ARC domain-containing protein n=1 Tax=Lactuca virosa TaxID=75947 RepID=A0AAU9P7K9_9ASTR|nr:unnamed protein product [Lactuca virosa]